MLENIIKGGILMVPLMICSVLALGAFLDRLWAFNAHRKVDNRSLRAKVLACLRQNKIADAQQLCSNTPGPVSAVLLSGLIAYEKIPATDRRADTIRVLVGDSMNDNSFHAMSAVQKRFNILSTVANVAPLLGMTGTVTGMIKSFTAMASAAGLDSGLVARGIAEALVTTAAGLLIAIGASVAYNWFTSLSDQIELEIQEGITETLDMLTTQANAGQQNG
jgi:biopolymer transport protein ExbB